MIENHAYLVDCVNDPEAHMESGLIVERMRNSLLKKGVEDTVFL